MTGVNLQRRAREREMRTYADSGLMGQTFAFIFDDPDSGLVLDSSEIGDQVSSIFHAGEFADHPVTDFGILMEHAAEIHVIDSCFVFLSAFLNLDSASKIVLHRYASVDPTSLSTSCPLVEHSMFTSTFARWTIRDQPLGPFHLDPQIVFPKSNEEVFVGDEMMGVLADRIVVFTVRKVRALPPAVRLAVRHNHRPDAVSSDKTETHKSATNAFLLPQTEAEAVPPEMDATAKKMAAVLGAPRCPMWGPAKFQDLGSVCQAVIHFQSIAPVMGQTFVDLRLTSGGDDGAGAARQTTSWYFLRGTGDDEQGEKGDESVDATGGDHVTGDEVRVTVVSVVFSQPWMLARQVESFRAYLVELLASFLVVVDTANPRTQGEYQRLCDRLEVDCVFRPTWFKTEDAPMASFRHGEALDWAWDAFVIPTHTPTAETHMSAYQRDSIPGERDEAASRAHCVKQKLARDRGSVVFITEQDTFMLRRFSVVAALRMGVDGGLGCMLGGAEQSRVDQDGRRIMYLHPSAFLVDIKRLPAPRSLSFMPTTLRGVDLDTGGSLAVYLAAAADQAEVDHVEGHVDHVSVCHLTVSEPAPSSCFWQHNRSTLTPEIYDGALLHLKQSSLWDLRNLRRRPASTKTEASLAAEHTKRLACLERVLDGKESV